MPEKTPADRQPKAKDTETGYRFTVKGKSYRLPPLNEKGAEEIPGAITYDAIMEPENEMAQMRLAMASLVAAAPTKAAMAALKSLSTKDMLTHVGAWMGGSSGSSD